LDNNIGVNLIEKNDKGQNSVQKNKNRVKIGAFYSEIRGIFGKKIKV